MKTDRILSEIIYLLNHDKVSASFLAERFQVSVRTIQRDIESISETGIPVYADAGKNGGYSILPTYKITTADFRKEEQQLVVKALESLATSWSSDTLNSLIEKYNAIAGKEGGQKIFWDFGVTKENSAVQKVNEILEKAIASKNYVEFGYRNISGQCSRPRVQPLAIYYRYYAWYFFAWSEKKQDYRNFKVARMEDVSVETEHFSQDHGDVQELIEKHHENYARTSVDIVIEFSPDDRHLVQEYFPDFAIEETESGGCRAVLRMPGKERLWKALILSFGGRVRIVSPKEYRDELRETASSFVKANAEDEI